MKFFFLTYKNKILFFLNHTIWYKPINQLDKKEQLWINSLKIGFISIKEFTKDRCLPRASALTYFTMLSLIPLLAIVFGIAQGFGMEQAIVEELTRSLEGQEALLQFVLDFVRSALDKTKGNLIAGVGLGVLLWTVMQMLSHVEMAMNDILDVRKQRPFIRKLTDYLAITIIAPIVLIAAGSFNVMLLANIETLPYSGILKVFVEFLPYFFMWILFAALYLIMPNTKIKLKSAIVAAILAGTAFHITQYYYFTFQMKISSYNVVYGSFAAIPLLLIWIRLSWIIVLFGMEIAAAMEVLEIYLPDKQDSRISDRRKKNYALQIVHQIVKRFEKNEKPYTMRELAQYLELPQAFVKEILKELNEADLIHAVVVPNNRPYAYQPAFNTANMRLSDVLKALDFYHADSEFLQDNQAGYGFFDEKLDQIGEQIEKSDDNVLFRDLKF